MESGNTPAAIEMAQKLIYDFRECGFDDVDRALCEFAVSLTLNPGAMRKTHVENLQELGLTDEQITVATQVTGYFNYINRVADGLGVDLEGWMTTSIDEWIEKKPNWRA